jgi:hypothetical protein
MKKLSQKEKDKLLSRIFWDLYINPDEIHNMLNRPIEEVTSILQINLYRRLLTSCDWYTLIKLFPLEKLNVILSDSIIEGIYPKDIKRKYLYARKYLSQ